VESKVKILCNNHRVCPEVMITLGEMGFTRIKDVSRESVSFDITAKGAVHPFTVEIAKSLKIIMYMSTKAYGSRYFQLT